MVPIRAANWKRLIRLFMNVLSRVSIIIKKTSMLCDGDYRSVFNFNENNLFVNTS